MEQTEYFTPEIISLIDRQVRWYMRGTYRHLNRLYDPEEVVSEVTVRFIEGKTLSKYNSDTASIVVFVQTAICNILKNLTKYEGYRSHLSVDAPVSETGETSFVDLQEGFNPCVEDLVYLFEILSVVREKTGEYGEQACQTPLGPYKYGAYICYLLSLLSYTYSEIGDMFGLSKSRVHKLVLDAKAVLNRQGLLLCTE